MRSSHLIQTALFTLLVVAFQTESYGQGPSFLKRLFQPKSSEQQAQQLQDKHGPWLVLAQTFNGEQGRNHATVFANELGAKLKVPVFIMERDSEINDVLGSGERIWTDEFGRTKTNLLEAKFANSGPNVSYAVLAGEFHTKEDPRIEAILKQIRQFEPKAKIPGFQRGMAFLTKNPLLPDDYFQSPPVDSFTEELNRQDWIKHSLLDCAGRFTVRVASFRGAEVIEVGVKKSNNVDDPSNALDRAANKAHKLTESLRGRGIEAFEYHDRFGSYVTIGSFKELGKETDGQFQYDPNIIAVLNKFCGYEQVTAKDRLTGAEMNTISVKKEVIKNPNGKESLIPFDIEGKPIAVPKLQAAKIYGGSVFK